jgi:hypothetical protein
MTWLEDLDGCGSLDLSQGVLKIYAHTKANSVAALPRFLSLA